MVLSDWLFDPSGLTPHGFCLSWLPGLIFLHAGSDAVIGLAYLSIPVALASFARQRTDLAYGWVAYLFVAFILACGATHILSILTLWVPAYGFEGIVKAITAVLSLITAVLLWPLIPRLVAVPSAEQLQKLNSQLATSIGAHQAALALLQASDLSLRTVNKELEARVEERTRDLETVNESLFSAMRALAQTEAEYRASFESAAVGKVLAEPLSRRIVRVNRAFAEMLNCEPWDLVGSNGAELTFRDDQADDRIEYGRLLNNEIDVLVREKRYIRRDGSTFWVRVTAKMSRGLHSGEPDLLIGTVENIDGRHQAEEHLLAANQELQKLVAEHTVALSQRGLLLRELYHRVKNNLQIVDGLLTMQARKVADPEARRVLLGLRHRIFALGLVHHQLMGSTDFKTFDVQHFLRELTHNIIDGSGSDKVGVEIDSAPLTVDLDFALPLGLMVTELLTNSLKHAFPSGEGVIRVKLALLEDAKVMLSVSDDGRSLEVNGKARESQSGIGMHLIKGLVAQMGGTMKVRTDVGTTTEIHLSAPTLP